MPSAARRATGSFPPTRSERMRERGRGDGEGRWGKREEERDTRGLFSRICHRRNNSSTGQSSTKFVAPADRPLYIRRCSTSLHQGDAPVRRRGHPLSLDDHIDA